MHNKIGATEKQWHSQFNLPLEQQSHFFFSELYSVPSSNRLPETQLQFNSTCMPLGR